MDNFIFQNQTKIIFGDRPILELACMLKKHDARKILLVYGSGSIIKNGILQETTTALKNVGIDYIEFSKVAANPLLSHALDGVKIARLEKIDFILAVGGGSCIDAAKFIAVGTKNNQDAEKIFKTSTPVDHALPIAAIVTIPATGSECSWSSIIKDEKTGLKYPLRCEAIRPKIAFINPRHCMTLPKEQIAYSVSDILSHNLERYFSSQDNIEYTDRLLEGAMKAIIEVGQKVYNEGTYEAWAQLCLAGTMAHNDMLSMGRIQDWGVHGIENKFLSGMNNIAHGQGLAVLFPVWMEYMAEDKKKTKKILQFFDRVFGIKGVNEGVSALRDFYKGLGLKVSLKELGIDAEPILKTAKEIYPADIKLGAFGQMGIDDIIQIFKNS